MAYITVGELKSYIGVGDTDDDGLLVSLIASAKATIDTNTGRTFEAATDSTKFFDCLPPTIKGYELNWATLGLDLCQITSVTNGNGSTVTAAQYVTMPINTKPYHGLRLKQYSGVTWDYTTDWEASISVTGRWAYSVTAPSEIAAVCREMAALMYKRRDTNSDINRAVIAGNATILPAGLSAESTQIINSFRRLV